MNGIIIRKANENWISEQKTTTKSMNKWLIERKNERTNKKDEQRKKRRNGEGHEETEQTKKLVNESRNEWMDGIMMRKSE